MTVLIAEDMDILRQDIRETLEKTGDIKVVAEAATGKSASDEYFSHKPDIVLMDIEMESKTAGIDAAERILEDDPDARIIYLTSHDSDEIIVSALATGARDYVVKGCSDEDLLSHIRSVMEGSCNLDSRVQAVLMGEYSRVKKQEKGLLYFVENLS
ncbi:MAG: response regulator transcription factor, partial [Bullifex sp.]